MIKRMNPNEFVKKTIDENRRTYIHFMNDIDSEFMGVYITLMDFKIRSNESIVNGSGLYCYYNDCYQITRKILALLRNKLKQ